MGAGLGGGGGGGRGGGGGSAEGLKDVLKAFQKLREEFNVKFKAMWA